ncbi:hypothetical protein BKA62DRAFT_63894 [Auriculariales sp. MPI-PUGE-AT-0066]|nr:hypothetical protein BKA62DRAFT_63894 [Auriculariales sp. MPI-PUGE-AT-0066]
MQAYQRRLMASALWPHRLDSICGRPGHGHRPPAAYTGSRGLGVRCYQYNCPSPRTHVRRSMRPMVFFCLLRTSRTGRSGPRAASVAPCLRPVTSLPLHTPCPVRIDVLNGVCARDSPLHRSRSLHLTLRRFVRHIPARPVLANVISWPLDVRSPSIPHSSSLLLRVTLRHRRRRRAFPMRSRRHPSHVSCAVLMDVLCSLLGVCA